MLLATLLGYHAGLREGDVRTWTWSAWRDDGTLFNKAAKPGETLYVPAHPELRAALDAEKRRLMSEHMEGSKLVPALTELMLRDRPIIVSRKGTAYTEDGFRASFFHPIARLYKAGKVEKGITFHGTRTSCGTNLALKGCTAKEIMAIMGHLTIEMAEYYTRLADRRRLAQQAMAKMIGSGS